MIMYEVYWQLFSAPEVAGVIGHYENEWTAIRIKAGYQIAMEHYAHVEIRRIVK